MEIKKILNKKFEKKGVEMSISTIIVLILIIAFIIIILLYSGNLRTYILTLLNNFTFRGN